MPPWHVWVAGGTCGGPQELGRGYYTPHDWEGASGGWESCACQDRTHPSPGWGLGEGRSRGPCRGHDAVRGGMGTPWRVDWGPGGQAWGPIGVGPAVDSDVLVIHYDHDPA